MVDGAPPSISSPDLAGILGTAAAPIVVDVRSMIDLAVVDRLVPGAIALYLVSQSSSLIGGRHRAQRRRLGG
jgi:hypothetical protein